MLVAIGSGGLRARECHGRSIRGRMCRSRATPTARATHTRGDSPCAIAPRWLPAASVMMSVNSDFQNNRDTWSSITVAPTKDCVVTGTKLSPDGGERGRAAELLRILRMGDVQCVRHVRPLRPRGRRQIRKHLKFGRGASAGCAHPLSSLAACSDEDQTPQRWNRALRRRSTSRAPIHARRTMSPP
jgi:hypothetical protein